MTADPKTTGLLRRAARGELSEPARSKLRIALGLSWHALEKLERNLQEAFGDLQVAGASIHRPPRDPDAEYERKREERLLDQICPELEDWS